MSHHPSETPDANGFADVEALLRDARRYVEPSPDLRPRFMEAVHGEVRRRMLRRHLSLVAAVAVVATVGGGLQLMRFGDAVENASARQQIARAVDASAPATTAGSDGLVWGLVDAFWSVRKRHAEAFGRVNRDAVGQIDVASDDLAAQIPRGGDSE